MIGSHLMAARRSKGDGSIYLRGDGRWCASVELGWDAKGNRRRKVVTARTQAEVLAKLRAVRRDVETHGDVPTKSMTVADWLDRWMAEIVVKRVKPRTFDGYAHKVGLIKASIGRVRLDRLTPSHVRQMQDHAAGDGRSTQTALHCHRLLSKALDDAMREGILLRNVARQVDAPRPTPAEVSPLTLDQCKALLASASDDPMLARWLLALVYGLRQGEALGMEWRRVDYAAGAIDVSWQMQRLTWRHGCAAPCGQRRGADCPDRHHGMPSGYQFRAVEGAWVLTRPKREKARMVPLLPEVEAVLRERQSLTAGEPNPHGLVFAKMDGTPWGPSQDNEAWHDLLERAGLPPMRLHDARHAAATLLQALGVEEAVRMAILGHSSATTQRGYAHVDLSVQAEGLGRLVRALTA